MSWSASDWIYSHGELETDVNRPCTEPLQKRGRIPNPRGDNRFESSGVGRARYYANRNGFGVDVF